MKRAKRKAKSVRRDLTDGIANLDRILEEATKRGHAPAFAYPKRTIDPPTLTLIEWRCLAWVCGMLAWIPARWAEPFGSLTKKIRAYLGDEAMRENAGPL